LLLFSIVVYEENIGLILLFSSLFYIFSWYKTGEPSITRITPALIAVTFSIGRWISQVKVRSAFGYQTKDIHLDLQKFILSTLTGFRVELQWGWTHAFSNIFPYRSLPITKTLLIVFIIFLIYGFLYLFLRFIPTFAQYNSFLFPVKNKYLLSLLLISLLIIASGYFPAIIVLIPSLEYFQSRVNILPNLGASIFVVSTLSLFVRYLKLSPLRSNIFLVTLAIPLLFIAGYAQLTSQKNAEAAWQEQKYIWNEFYLLAPDFKPGTKIVLIMRNQPWVDEAKPFMGGPWGFSNALSTLYGHNDLEGYFSYEKTKDFIKQDSGLIYVWNSDFIPYKNAVFFEYDAKQRRLILFNKDAGILYFTADCKI
jgi:hypothetical protein